MLQIQNENDYTEIVNQYADMIFRIACQNLSSQTDAQDVVQDVFGKLLKHRQKKFEDDEHLKAWLIRVAINRCRDYGRMKKVRREEAIDKHQIENDMEYQQGQEHSELFEALECLSAEDRTIVYLYYFEGFTIKEIAHIMKKMQNTVSSKLTRARKKLKNLLEEP